MEELTINRILNYFIHVVIKVVAIHFVFSIFLIKLVICFEISQCKHLISIDIVPLQLDDIIYKSSII